MYTCVAYAVTEEAQHRELDGPSTNILTDMISNALPIEKAKDKISDLNNVTYIFLTFLL